MKSMSTAISWCSVAFGYFGSSVAVEVVDAASGGWLRSNNLNRDRLEYFYWLLAGLSVVNFGVYLLCASWYKYKKVEVMGLWRGLREEKLWVTNENIGSVVESCMLQFGWVFVLSLVG